ncbi:hypothetical protein FIBSPDRAFT_878187 [Athelia psychrophila]|uniref:Uncharacterized protein n=1 Tax=Athelia psychrophila TaxID=1759441 RepID=A0A167V8B3_9AGAM|nr:hypothetical protein FIBSPDRAFT_878187 [Fibularhizoctonia sp. CBS 109695]
MIAPVRRAAPPRSQPHGPTAIAAPAMTELCAAKTAASPELPAVNPDKIRLATA